MSEHALNRLHAPLSIPLTRPTSSYKVLEVPQRRGLQVPPRAACWLRAQEPDEGAAGGGGGEQACSVWSFVELFFRGESKGAYDVVRWGKQHWCYSCGGQPTTVHHVNRAHSLALLYMCRPAPRWTWLSRLRRSVPRLRRAHPSPRRCSVCGGARRWVCVEGKELCPSQGLVE